MEGTLQENDIPAQHSNILARAHPAPLQAGLLLPEGHYPQPVDFSTLNQAFVFSRQQKIKPIQRDLVDKLRGEKFVFRRYRGDIDNERKGG